MKVIYKGTKKFNLLRHEETLIARVFFRFDKRFTLSARVFLQIIFVVHHPSFTILLMHHFLGSSWHYRAADNAIY